MSALEAVAACLQETARAYGAADPVRAPAPQRSRPGSPPFASFAGTRATPRVHGGGSLAGNESARIRSRSLSAVPAFARCSSGRPGASRSCVPAERFMLPSFRVRSRFGDRSWHITSGGLKGMLSRTHASGECASLPLMSWWRQGRSVMRQRRRCAASGRGSAPRGSRGAWSSQTRAGRRRLFLARP